VGPDRDDNFTMQRSGIRSAGPGHRLPATVTSSTTVTLGTSIKSSMQLRAAVKTNQ